MFHPANDERPRPTPRELPQVTLVAIDGTTSPIATEASLARASSELTFANVLFFAPSRPNASPALYERCRWIEIPPKTLKQYNQFCLAELHKYIHTSHCLSVQSDSYIVNAAAWDDAWLGYDYIGAPWPPGHSGTEYRVGNSGFCLRSRNLLEATSFLPNDSYVWRGKRKQSCRDDVITCVMYRPHLERLGLKFAPVEVAARFAFENPTPEAPALDGQFGVHEYRRRSGSVSGAHRSG
jgi:hypothetical protein